MCITSGVHDDSRCSGKANSERHESLGPNIAAELGRKKGSKDGKKEGRKLTPSHAKPDGLIKSCNETNEPEPVAMLETDLENRPKRREPGKIHAHT